MLPIKTLVLDVAISSRIIQEVTSQSMLSWHESLISETQAEFK